MEKLSRVKKYHQDEKTIKKIEPEINYKNEYYRQPEEVSSNKVIDIRSSISAKKEMPTELLILKEIREKQNRQRMVNPPTPEQTSVHIEQKDAPILEDEQKGVVDDNYIKQEYRQRNQKIQNFYVDNSDEDEYDDDDNYSPKGKMDIVTKIMLGVVAVLVVLIIVLVIVIFL